MTLELLKKIKEIIAAYQGNMEVCIAEIKKVFEQFIGENGIDANAMYKPEYIRETIKKEMDAALENNKKLNMVYNQQIKNAIETAKKQMLPMLFKKEAKPSDYAIKVSNALQLIQMEGAEISDEAAHEYLNIFIDDYDQMKIFKRVIGKQVELETATGESAFPMTFGKLNKIELALNMFNEMEGISENIFLHKKLDGQIYTVNHVQYIIPRDGYGEVSDELEIQKFAEIIENIASSDKFIQEVAIEPESGE